MVAYITSTNIADAVKKSELSRAVFEVLHCQEGLWTASIRAERGFLQVFVDGPHGFQWKCGFYEEETSFLSTRIAPAISEHL